MIGEKFGRLTVVAELPVRKRKQIVFMCICECGNTSSVVSSELRTGKTRSCGCFARDRARELGTTHGMSKSAAYTSWQSMKLRVMSKPEYTSRGIQACTEWMASFEAFYADMGNPPEGMTLERLNNNDGYHKANCKWADRTTQARNRRTSKITYEDACLIKTLKQHGKTDAFVANLFSVCKATVSHISSGRNWKDAVCIPI